MVVSILSLSWNRIKTIKESYHKNLGGCGLPWDQLELLVCDQGSTDGSQAYLHEHFRFGYFRQNKFNEGIGRSFNQLMLRAKGDYICLMGTDIVNPSGWLKTLLEYAEAVPNSGIVGIKCTAEIPPLQTKPDKNGNPRSAHYLTPTCDKVFGTMMFSRKVFESVGGFHEGFHPYGFEDSDFNNRITLAGFNSFYVPDLASEHIGGDVGENSVYRRMKDESLARNGDLFWRRHAAYLDKSLQIKEPLPPPRDPQETEVPLPPIDLSNVDLEAVRRTPIGE